MMLEIKLFLLVLSSLFLLKTLIEFGVKLTQENPEPMTFSNVEKTLQLISLSYIITYILI